MCQIVQNRFVSTDKNLLTEVTRNITVIKKSIGTSPSLHQLDNSAFINSTKLMRLGCILSGVLCRVNSLGLPCYFHESLQSSVFFVKLAISEKGHQNFSKRHLKNFLTA